MNTLHDQAEPISRNDHETVLSVRSGMGSSF